MHWCTKRKLINTIIYKKFNKPIDRGQRKNKQIRASEVLLIDEHGNKLGTVAIEEAQQMALDQGIDLVEVSTGTTPPVCKLVDFGKYQYRKDKAERKQKAKQKKIEIKGIRLTLKIGKHDIEVRLKRAAKFLEQGDKVKIEMLLRGREKAHFNLAKEIFQNFHESLGEDIHIEQPVTRKGAKLISIVAKKK
ncbi:translation initiation factor IF-3 [Patescibacteria group bacterium]|nr:translation initiation factor IF-3 [Patescibacteria group bacterium]MBU1075003.1 translation initiation factor IF-3 [Patescibacteria group bacterium]MBU1952488.1 translation initiation factor IF-3 [Patescibacteria group bacterium]